MMQNLGETIRKIRKENNLNLKQLSGMTGFSISFISQLERGKSSATLESLKKISLALNVNPAIFFEDINMQRKENNIKEDAIEQQDISYQDLNKRLPNPAFTPLLVKLKPQQDKGNLFTHEGQEFLFILKGELTVKLEEKVYVLKENNSIMFDSNINHYWYNYTDNDVVFLCVSYDEQYNEME